MHPVLGTMMPEICEAPHLSASLFQSSFGSAFNKWDAFITFPLLLGVTLLVLWICMDGDSPGVFQL